MEIIIALLLLVGAVYLGVNTIDFQSQLRKDEKQAAQNRLAALQAAFASTLEEHEFTATKELVYKDKVKILFDSKTKQFAYYSIPDNICGVHDFTEAVQVTAEVTPAGSASLGSVAVHAFIGQQLGGAPGQIINADRAQRKAEERIVKYALTILLNDVDAMPVQLTLISSEADRGSPSFDQADDFASNVISTFTVIERLTTAAAN